MVSDATLAWLFLLGLTSGARIEEIGQTELVNIKIDGGVWHFDLGPEARVKNKASRRMIPLHAFILELGFEHYVEALRQAGQIRLFPDLSENQFDKVSKEASRRANRIIDKAVGKASIITFHSLRHNFKDLARDKLIEKYVIDQLIGHAGVTAGDKYGIGARLSILKSELDRVEFEMVDWTPILKAFGSRDWNVIVRAQQRAD